MTKEPDFSELARQYLDLWEDQLAAMAADPDLAEQTARFFDTMARLGGLANPMAAPGLSALMAQMSGSMSPTTDRADGPFNGPDDQAATQAGAATAAAASADRDQQLVELARRLADVEKRLHKLETGSRGASRKAAKKPSPGKRKRD